MITYNLIGNIASGYAGDSNLKNLQAALASSNDPEFCINIDCNGGSVMEGLKMYDALRNSGKNIYTNITGGCHSMAVVILLAAPAENRSANKNCRALIHRVYTQAPGQINAGTAEQIKEQLEMEENAILDIYESRTGRSREDLQALMAKEDFHTAQELLEYGFISHINDYSTNQYFENMKTHNSNVFARFLANAKNLLHDPQNFDYMDESGAVVLSTEGEEDNLAVGVAVTLASGETSGTFVLADGRTVTVEDGVVTDIQEPQVDPEPEPDPALVEENNNLRSLLQEAVNLIQEQEATINSLQASKYVPRRGVQVSPSNYNRRNQGPQEPSVADLKAAARAKQEIVNKFKTL